MTHWEKLIHRYADEKHVPCNCRQAYYQHGSITKHTSRNGTYILGQCEYGCQANQYMVKDYIAEKVLKELKK